MILEKDFRITDIKILKDNKHIEMWGVVQIRIEKGKYEWAEIHFPKVDMSIQEIQLDSLRGRFTEITRECRLDSKDDVFFEIRILDKNWQKRIEETLKIMREDSL